MDDLKAECIFNEQVHVKEEEDNIKDESEWEDSAGLHGISAAAARAGLYVNHVVKDELVLGPAGVQPADFTFTLYACQASAARAQPVLRDRAGLSADARRPETHVANNADVGNQVHSDANIHTEKETYVCAICNKRFALKTQLVEHVIIIHIHQEPEQEEIGVANNVARAPNATEHPALRDCVVTLERLELVQLAAGRDERLARRAGRDADIEKQIHGNVDVSTEEETYICDTCKKWFPLKSQLVEHVISHIQRPESGRGSAGAPNARQRPALIDCVVTLELVELAAGRNERLARRAGRDTDIEKEINGNIDVSTEEETYICDTCKKWFPLKSQLVEHVMSHIQRLQSGRGSVARAPNATEHPALRDCVVTLERLELVELAAGRDERLARRAGRDADIEKQIYGNVDVGTEEETYICDTCKRWFPLKSQLVEHVMSHIQRPTRAQDGRHACLVCYKDFSVRSNLKRHERTHTGERSFRCRICEQKFKESSYLKRHVRIHTGEKPYSCGICTKKFAWFTSLKSHESTHSGEKPFYCRICKQKFKQLCHLKRHEQTHTGERPFCCEICKQKFTRLITLKRHKRIHTGEKPFPCGRCKRKFRRSHHLKRHERTHTGEKPFACEICEKLFARLGNLKEHIIRIHADRKPFSCDICQKRFAQKTALVAHVRRHGKPR